MSPEDADDRRTDEPEPDDDGPTSEGDDGSGTEETAAVDDVDVTGADEPAPDEALEHAASDAVEELDARIVDLLSWILDTETRAKIYVFLLANPASTSEEVATGTGLYPSTVREALAELHDEGRVDREKRESDGAGNNPYEYTAIPPSELVGGVADQVQRELNTIFSLDRLLDREEEPFEADAEPVTITVDEAPSSVESSEGDADEGDDTGDTDDTGGVEEDDVDEGDDADEGGADGERRE